MTVLPPPPAAPKRRRPSGGKETAGIRQSAFVDRQKRKGLLRVAVWVPIGTQAKIRETAAALRAAAQPKKAMAMYDVKTLERNIEAAMEAAYHESVDDDVHFDVRTQVGKGIYTVLRELADGGTVLWSTAEGFGDPSEIAERIIAATQDRLDIEAIDT